MGKPKKKIVLLLLEGSSDEYALLGEISRLYEVYDSEVEVFPRIRNIPGMSNDVTVVAKDPVESREGIISSDYIYDFLQQRRVYPKDIARIIHIVDMDGAFTDDANVVPGEGKPLYWENRIEAGDVDGIVRRNAIKRRNLSYLSGLKTISVYNAENKGKSKKRPYSIYYFSSNLDHVLHGEANMDPQLKGKAAREFRDRCKQNKDYFTEFFLKQEAVRDRDYSASWEWIKEENRSLQPHSNLGVLVQELTGR